MSMAKRVHNLAQPAMQFVLDTKVCYLARRAIKRFLAAAKCKPDVRRYICKML